MRLGRHDEVTKNSRSPKFLWDFPAHRALVLPEDLIEGSVNLAEGACATLKPVAHAVVLRVTPASLETESLLRGERKSFLVHSVLLDQGGLSRTGVPERSMQQYNIKKISQLSNQVLHGSLQLSRLSFSRQ
jgi:hypothetical protein